MSSTTRTTPDWVRRRADPDARFGLRVTLFALALSLLAIPFGALVVAVTSQAEVVQLDESVARALHPWVVAHPGAVTALGAISFFGDPLWFVVLVPVVAGFWLARRQTRLAAYVVATALLGGLVNTAAKLAVDRDRPQLPDPVATASGQSFPSGHVMTSTYAYGAILLSLLPLVPRRLRWLAFSSYAAVVVAVACSRLGLGVHYVSDVVAGAVLGLAWLAASTAAFSIWRVERGRRAVELEEGVEPEAG